MRDSLTDCCPHAPPGDGGGNLGLGLGPDRVDPKLLAGPYVGLALLLFSSGP